MTELDVFRDIFQVNIRAHPAMMAEPLSRENITNLSLGYLAQPWPQFGQRAFLFISSSPEKQIVAAWYYTQNPEMENETFGYHKPSNVYFLGRRNAQFYADNNQIVAENGNKNLEKKSKEAAIGSILEKHKVAIFHGPERVKDCLTSVLDVIIHPEDFEICVVGAIMIENEILVNTHVNMRNDRIREFMADFAKELKKKSVLEQRKKEKEEEKERETTAQTNHRLSNKKKCKLETLSRSHYESRSRSRSPNYLSKYTNKRSRSPSSTSSSSSHSISRTKLARRDRRTSSSSSSSSSLSSSSSPSSSSSSSSTLSSSLLSTSSSSLLTALSQPASEVNVHRKRFWHCEEHWLPFMCDSEFTQQKLVVGQWDIHFLPLFAAFHIDKLPLEKCFPGCNTWVFYKLLTVYGRENSIPGACLKWKDFSCDVRINFLIAPGNKGDRLEFIRGMHKDYAKRYTVATSGRYILKVIVIGRFGTQPRFINFAYSDLTAYASKQLLYKHAPSNIASFIFNKKTNSWDFVRFLEPCQDKKPTPTNIVDAIRIINQSNYITLQDIMLATRQRT